MVTPLISASNVAVDEPIHSDGDEDDDGEEWWWIMRWHGQERVKIVLRKPLFVYSDDCCCGFDHFFQNAFSVFCMVMNVRFSWYVRMFLCFVDWNFYFFKQGSLESNSMYKQNAWNTNLHFSSTVKIVLIKLYTQWCHYQSQSLYCIVPYWILRNRFEKKEQKKHAPKSKQTFSNLLLIVSNFFFK